MWDVGHFNAEVIVVIITQLAVMIVTIMEPIRKTTYENI